MPELVVFRTLVLIGKDFICLVCFFKFNFRFLVVRIQIRVILFCKFPVSGFYFVIARRFFNAENLKSALNGTDTAAIKAATEKLTEVSYEVFGKIYQQQAQQNGGAAGFDPNAGAAGSGNNGGSNSSNGNDDGVVDADYEVVDN